MRCSMKSLMSGMRPSSRGWPPTMASRIAEGFLHLRVLEKIIENKLRLFAALQFDDDAHAFARGFVADVRDPFEFFGLNEFSDAL